MPILYLILILCAIGVALYLMNAYVPMPLAYKKLVNIAVIVLVVIWLLNLVGLLPTTATVPRVR
jgi:uncharacterized membrane protein